MHQLTSLFLLVLFLGLSACGDSTAKSDRLTLTGSSTVAPLMAEIARRYEAQHPEVRIDVQTGGSTRGVTDAREGRVPIGMASRGLKPEEAADLRAITIARDGIACIVHADNPLTSLTHDQVVRVFRGELNDWSQLGAPAGPIVVVTKAEGRSTLELFCHHFGLQPQEIAAQVVIGDNAQGIKSVAANPGAIGYVSIGAAEVAAADGTPIRLLGLDGQVASVAALRAGDWPLSRPLNLVLRADATIDGHARGLLDLAQNAAVDDLIIGLSFVPPHR